MVAWVFTRKLLYTLFHILIPLPLISCNLLQVVPKTDNSQMLHVVNVTDVVEWNPSLSYNATDPSACVLLPGYRYCIGGPSPASIRTSSTTNINISRFTTRKISVSSASPVVRYSPNGS
ncbi:hypothetical protein GGI43DRAFT_408863 [Trichoderma evansii]